MLGRMLAHLAKLAFTYAPLVDRLSGLNHIFSHTADGAEESTGTNVKDAVHRVGDQIGFISLDHESIVFW